MILTKKFSIFLFLLLLMSSVLAFESAISNYGFEGIKLNSEDQKECSEFVLPVFEEEGDGILSIRAEFIGSPADNTYVSVQFNNGEELVFWPENFVCNTDCVARIFTPSLKKQNLVKICLNNGGKTTFGEVNKNSSIGLYETPVIKITHTSPEELILGQRAKMKINVSNTGSVPVNVFVQFLSEDLRTFLKITSFDIVEGEASARVLLRAGEEKEFIYYIKPTQSSSYNLPSAVVSFENIFSENQKIFSNHPQLSVKNPNQIDLVLVGEEVTGSIINFKLIVKNNWDEEFSGELIINPNDLIIDYDKKLTLKPLQEVELNFKTKELLPGKYPILAEIDSNEIIYTSESTEFVLNKKDYSFEILFSFIAVIVALGILLWIYIQKN